MKLDDFIIPSKAAYLKRCDQLAKEHGFNSKEEYWADMMKGARLLTEEERIINQVMKLEKQIMENQKELVVLKLRIKK